MPYTKFDPNNPPPPLMTSEPGSFAQRTMTTRIPAIIQQVLADHADKHPDTLKHALQRLHDEVKSGQPMRPLKTDAADGPDWAKAYRPHAGKSWHNAPWYFAEAFLYRRLLQASGFFGGFGDYWEGNDPFIHRKLEELQSETPWQIFTTTLTHAEGNSTNTFRALLHYCVWGNRIDLSYNQIAEATGRAIAIENEQANLLVDDTEAVLAHLVQRSSETKERSHNLSNLLPRTSAPSLTPPICIDFICDNTGTELLLDLALSDFLLRHNWAQQVTLHLKAHPTFVSDAVPRDIKLTLDAISRYPKTDLVPAATRLNNFLENGRLDLKADLFWNSSRFFWEMPQPLLSRLAHARLVIVKGDANYRRLLGDSRWPTTVPVQDAIPYFPAPFVALRTMKSDPIVGLKAGVAETLDEVDSEWRVNGKRGIIQAVI
jgi:uncharacterized protein with ATP-grasp and redox domains